MQKIIARQKLVTRHSRGKRGHAREEIPAPSPRKCESARRAFAGHSRTFPMGIRGHSWSFAGIRGQCCARLLQDSLVFSVGMPRNCRHRPCLGYQEMSSELSSIIMLIV
jgi:hypothetical protein